MSEGWNILVVDDEPQLGLSYAICWKRIRVWVRLPRRAMSPKPWS